MKNCTTAHLSTQVPAWAPASYAEAIASEMEAARYIAATMPFAGRAERRLVIDVICSRAQANRIGWSRRARKAMAAGIRAELGALLGDC